MSNLSRVICRVFESWRRLALSTLIGVSLASSAAQAAEPTINIGAQEQQGQVTTFKNVRVDYPDHSPFTLSFDKITVENLDTSSVQGRFRASRIVAETIVLDPDTISEETLTLPSLELSDIDAPLPSAQSLSTTGKVGEIAPLLKTLLEVKLSRLAAPKLQWQATSTSSSARALLQNFSLEGMDQGKIGSFGFKIESFQIKQTGKEKPEGFSLDEIAFKKIDLKPIAAWFDDSLAASIPAGRHLIYGEIAFTGFRLKESDNEITFNLSSQGGGLSAPPAAPSKIYEVLSRLGSDAVDVPVAERVKILQALFTAFSFDNLQVTDFHFAESGKGGADFDLIRLSGFDLPKIDEFRIDGMALDIPKENLMLKLGSFEILGIQIVNFEPLLKLAAGDRIALFLGTGGWPGRQFSSAKIGDLDIESPDVHVSLKTYQMDAPRWVANFPVELKSTIEKLAVTPKKLDEKGEAMVAALGIRTSVLNANIAYGWDEGAELLTLAPSEVRVEGIGGLKMSGVIGQVKRGIFENPWDSVRDVQKIDFRQASLSVTDLGKLSSMIDLIVKEQQQDRVQLAQLAGGFFKLFLSGKLEMTEAAEKVSAAIETFIRDSKSLEISIIAKTPVSLETLMSLGDGGEAEKTALTAIKKSLSIEARANQ